MGEAMSGRRMRCVNSAGIVIIFPIDKFLLLCRFGCSSA
jgi:hypothetical protein